MGNIAPPTGSIHPGSRKLCVYEDAVQLQKDAQALGEEQKARPDDDFRDADGLLPLASVEHKGQTWKVGE